MNEQTGGTTNTLTTAEFAAMNMVKAQSVRARLCRFGRYFGVRPIKLMNGRTCAPNCSRTASQVCRRRTTIGMSISKRNALRWLLGRRGWPRSRRCSVPSSPLFPHSPAHTAQTLLRSVDLDFPHCSEQSAH